MKTSTCKNRTRLSVPRLALTTSACTLLFVGAVRAQDTVKINSRRLSDRVLVTWGCDHFQGTNMAVITTDSGIVLIDTGLSPTTVGRQRVMIEDVLGNSDFRYLINTHMHHDHAFANDVFPEATVVAHGNGATALQREFDDIPDFVGRLQSNLNRFREWAAATSPDSAEGIRAREGVAVFTTVLDDVNAGVSPQFPSVTFDDHHSLDLGDVHLELFDFTGFHSDSDILILLPEERMLFTGDAFWGGQLPMLHEGIGDGFHRLMNNWRTIFETSPDLEIMVPGHSDAPLTVEQFRGMYVYLSRLWNDVQGAREAGTPLLGFLMQNVFEERYPEVADFNTAMREYNVHQHNIYVLWRLVGS